MKMLCCTLLLIAGGFFGWQRYAEHQREQAQKAHEMFEGYDRCVAPLDEAYESGKLSPTWNSQSQEAKKSEEVWAKARQSCRDFWFSASATK
jgi:predicted negative regulator of RcsB-dependent stress response